MCANPVFDKGPRTCSWRPCLVPVADVVADTMGLSLNGGERLDVSVGVSGALEKEGVV